MTTSSCDNQPRPSLLNKSIYWVAQSTTKNISDRKTTETQGKPITNERGINYTRFIYFFPAQVLHKSLCWSEIGFLLLLQVSVLILSSRWDFLLVIRSIALSAVLSSSLDTESISMMDCGTESRGELWHLLLFF